MNIIFKKKNQCFRSIHVVTFYKVIFKDVYLENLDVKSAKCYFGWFNMVRYYIHVYIHKDVHYIYLHTHTHTHTHTYIYIYIYIYVCTNTLVINIFYLSLF